MIANSTSLWRPASVRGAGAPRRVARDMNATSRRAGVPPAAPGVPAPATPEVAPSFDFYEVLPGGEPNALPTVPAVAPAPVVPRYFLQAGAFQNAADADNLKAQLALLGVEATIQTAEVAEKGVFHRVRVGPFAAMDEINHTRSLLAQNNIPVTLVTDEPPKQEIP